MATMGTTRTRERFSLGEMFAALGLALGPVVALGFSRFAYSLLLPPMREQLHWNFAQAGGLNTSNAIGYIIGTLITAWVAQRLGNRLTFLGSMAISALILLLSGATSTYTMLLVLRFIGGISTAITFVLGSALAARIRPTLMPVYFTGPGLGIIISGIVVPTALTSNSGGWRLGWIILGVAALVALIPTWLAYRTLPKQNAQGSAMLRLGDFRKLSPTFFGYLLFGAGYVTYMTFVIALLHAQGATPWMSALFFIILGIASALSTLGWGPILARCKGGWGPAIVSAIVLIGTLPVLLYPGFPSALVSAIIFGGSFMAGPTAVTGLCRRHLPSSFWTAGIAIMTAGFAVGQAIGPVLSGWLSDYTGNVSAGVWLAPILLLLALVIAIFQQEHRLLEEHKQNSNTSHKDHSTTRSS